MQLALSTWPEVEDYLEVSDGIILPVGSTEQHGPIGLIGTDALCASVIAEAAGEIGVTSAGLAEIDLATALAVLAEAENWTRPKVDDSRAFGI